LSNKKYEFVKKGMTALFPIKELERLAYYWENRYCPECKDTKIQILHTPTGIGWGCTIVCLNCDWKDDITDYGCW